MMPAPITLNVNGESHTLTVDPKTPLLYVLRNDLELTGPKYGCGSEQCGACKVLVDGEAVPSCQLPAGQVQNLPIITVEGLGNEGALHPLQEAFVAEQAIQCGYCAAGMIMAAQGLLNRVRYPTDDQIREALADNLCRCGVYDRVRRAIRYRIGRPAGSPPYEVRQDASGPVAADGEPSLPRSLQQTPELDRWLRIDEGGTITAFSGKVEYGQGIKTALAQIVAEELDVSLARVRVVMADTALTPDEGLTVSSMSLETSGAALRQAAITARQRILDVAYEALEAAPERLVISDGTITDLESGRSTSYWELFGGQRLGGRVTSGGTPKPAGEHTAVGRPAPRLDLPAKVTGVPTFVHDLALPEMVHGRIVRPPHPHTSLLAVDTEAVARLPGVLKVVRNGNFLGVIAIREETAVAARDALLETAIWEQDPALAEPDSLYERLFGQPQQALLLQEGAVVEEEAPPPYTPEGAAQTLTATYFRPYQMHASLGPSAAVAHFTGAGELALWIHSQGVFPQRAAIAHVLGIAEEKIHVIHREGAGCYGHNGSDDAALDAALLARALPGRPVSLKWMRADEHRWEPYAPAMQVRMEASLDEEGAILAWNHDVSSPAHTGRSRTGPGLSGLLAAGHLAEPFATPEPGPSVWPHGGSHRNADPLYTFPRQRIVKHHLPHSPLRVSSMRGLGALANVFAIESFVDEVAHAAGMDPLAFRLRYLEDERARAVLEAAAEKAGWQPGEQRRGDGRGQGLAFAQYKNRQTYAAVVVEVQVDRKSGEIRLERAAIAADAGQIVNPDGLSNQLEGGLVQAASLTLCEEVTWDREAITSVDWDSYPILRFPGAPVIETVLLDRPGLPPVGAGEAAMGPTPAAIANAVFAASGIRLRRLPFTPARVLAALR